jgi:hypothetical protein
MWMSSGAIGKAVGEGDRNWPYGRRLSTHITVQKYTFKTQSSLTVHVWPKKGTILIFKGKLS